MSFQFYKALFSFIGLLYCLRGQVNGHSTPIVYVLEETFENSVDSDFNPVMPSSDKNNNIQFWNKESGHYDFGFKELEHIMSSSINLRKKFLLNHMSQILSAKYPQKKSEANILKRIPRQVITVQDNTSTQTTNLSNTIAPIKKIGNETVSSLTTPIPTSTIVNTESQSNFTTSSVSSNITSDQSLVSTNNSSVYSTITPDPSFNASTSTPMINTSIPLNSSTSNLAPVTITDLPLNFSTMILPVDVNTTQSNVIKTLSDHSPTQQEEGNYFSATVIFLGISIILAIGLFVAYKKYQDNNRHACYQMGDICRNNVQEETPV